MIKMAEEIIGKLLCRVASSVAHKDYIIYFTDKRIIGEFLGGTAAAFVAGGAVGQAIARKRHKKKGEEIMEEKKTSEQILASHEKNFFVNYEDIVNATVKKKECIMKLTEKRPGLTFGLTKKAIFLYNKNDKDNTTSVLTRVIPDKVVVK